jgi:hypothetical protein
MQVDKCHSVSRGGKREMEKSKYDLPVFDAIIVTGEFDTLASIVIFFFGK